MEFASLVATRGVHRVILIPQVSFLCLCAQIESIRIAVRWLTVRSTVRSFAPFLPFIVTHMRTLVGKIRCDSTLSFVWSPYTNVNDRYIDRTRQLVDTKLTALVGESYNRYHSRNDLFLFLAWLTYTQNIFFFTVRIQWWFAYNSYQNSKKSVVPPPGDTQHSIFINCTECRWSSTSVRQRSLDALCCVVSGTLDCLDARQNYTFTYLSQICVDFRLIRLLFFFRCSEMSILGSSCWSECCRLTLVLSLNSFIVFTGGSIDGRCAARWYGCLAQIRWSLSQEWSIAFVAQDADEADGQRSIDYWWAKKRFRLLRLILISLHSGRWQCAAAVGVSTRDVCVHQADVGCWTSRTCARATAHVRHHCRLSRSVVAGLCVDSILTDSFLFFPRSLCVSLSLRCLGSCVPETRRMASCNSRCVWQRFDSTHHR